MATTPFEQKFGILANSALTDKLPGLEDDSLGFQVVQSEDDDSRGFGVQIYDIGKHLVLVPMFFIKGRIKGGEVMYVKDLNKFMPLTEMDINALKSGKTFSMGEVELNDKEDDKSKGTPYRISTMELNWLNSKRAGEVGLIDSDDIIKMMTQASGGELKVDLDCIKMFGPKAANDLARQIGTVPKLANALLSVHTAEEIYDSLIKQVDSYKTIQKIASMKADKPLKFIDNPYCKEAAELPDDRKRLLMQYGIVAIDNRKEASIAMKEKKAVTRWGTPNCNGRYDILMRDGSTVKGDILTVDANKFGPCLDEDCCCSDTYSYCSKNEARVTVIIDGTICTRKVSDLSVDTNTVEKSTIGESVTVDALRSLVLKDGEDRWTKGKMFPKNAVIFYDGQHDVAYKGNIEKNGNEVVFRDGDKNLRIVLTGKSGALFVKSGILYVPTTAKLVKLHEYDEAPSWSSRPSDIVSAALVNGGFETVKVASDGRNWKIDDSNGGTEPSSYAENFKYLMEQVGLREKQASEILELARQQAGRNRMGEPVSFWCKCAFEDHLDPSNDPWFGVGDDHFLTREAGRLGGPLDDKAIERMRKASKTGVKEIVDTQLMSELAKSAYSVDKTQDYLPILSKALDRICRTLVLFYWHNEDFEERYGKQNMPQLEDALKDNIRALGDLIGYLHDKSVKDTDEAEDDTDDDLGQEMA